MNWLAVASVWREVWCIYSWYLVNESERGKQSSVEYYSVDDMCGHTTFLMHIWIIDAIPAFLHTLTVFRVLSSDSNRFLTKRKGIKVTSNKGPFEERSNKKQWWLTTASQSSKIKVGSHSGQMLITICIKMANFTDLILSYRCKNIWSELTIQRCSVHDTVWPFSLQYTGK